MLSLVGLLSLPFGTIQTDVACLVPIGTKGDFIRQEYLNIQNVEPLVPLVAHDRDNVIDII